MPPARRDFLSWQNLCRRPLETIPLTIPYCREAKDRKLKLCRLQTWVQSLSETFCSRISTHNDSSFNSAVCSQVHFHIMRILFVRGLFNPLNAELNPICYLLALLGAHHFLHVSRIRVNKLVRTCKMALVTELRRSSGIFMYVRVRASGIQFVLQPTIYNIYIFDVCRL